MADALSRNVAEGVHEDYGVVKEYPKIISTKYTTSPYVIDMVRQIADGSSGM